MGVAYELRGNLSAGYVGVALLNVMTFSASLKAFISSWTQLEVSLGAVSRVQGFERETACENLPQEKGEVSAAWPEAGAIEFQQVSASYR
jgi:ATP-binding cassette subfamily C (CFTR/MRP) protein 1